MSDQQIEGQPSKDEIFDIIVEFSDEKKILVKGGLPTVFTFSLDNILLAARSISRKLTETKASSVLPWLKDLIGMAEDGYKLHHSNAVHQEFMEEDRDILREAKRYLTNTPTLIPAPALPPSPVGPKTKEEILYDHKKSGGNTDILAAMQAYADQEAHNPSRAGEISPFLESWTSVKEGFPEKGTYVDVWVPSREMAFMATRRDDGMGEGWNSKYYEVHEGVTHWKERPAGPSAEIPLTPAPEVKEEGTTNEQVKIESLERVVKKAIAEAEEYKNILSILYRELFHISESTVIDFDKIRELYKNYPAPEPVKDTPVEQNPFGLSDIELKQLLDKCLKPEEISGEASVQHDRIRELVKWFSRGGNPKWFQSHAYELVYYIATNSVNRFIDLNPVREKAYYEGVNITPNERGCIERHLPDKITQHPEQPAHVPDTQDYPHAEEVHDLKAIIRSLEEKAATLTKQRDADMENQEKLWEDLTIEYEEILDIGKESWGERIKRLSKKYTIALKL